MSRVKKKHRSREQGLLKNKKGFLAGAFVDIWVFVIFAIALLIFFLLFRLTFNDPKVQTINAGKAVHQSHYFAGLYLNMPVDVDGAAMVMRDLIVLAAMDPEYKGMLEDKSEEFLALMGDDKCNAIIFEGINIELENCKWYDTETLKINVLQKLEGDYSNPVPLPDPSKKVTVYVYYDPLAVKAQQDKNAGK